MGPRRWSRGRGGRSSIFDRHCPSFNGATAMEQWKRTSGNTTQRRVPRLQWGHGDGAVEEASRWIRLCAIGVLQWGHGDGAVEEHDSKGGITATMGGFNGATAMEPWKRIYERGEKIAEGELQWGHGDGAVEETGKLSQKSRQPNGFNGATAMEPWKRPAMTTLDSEVRRLQWGHGDGAVEEHDNRSYRSAPNIRFNGATAMEPWKRGRLTPAHTGRSSFKGATAMEPWKRWRVRRSDGRGERFNGATAMEPWKRGTFTVTPSSSGALQWGHGDGAVEEFVGLNPSAPISGLQWGHGDGAVEELTCWHANWRSIWVLQWGHGDGAVEEQGDDRWLTPRVTSFNGATAMEPWKRDQLVGVHRRISLASMGPRRWSRGRAGAMKEPGREGYCFNGATAMEPWKSRGAS